MRSRANFFPPARGLRGSIIQLTFQETTPFCRWSAAVLGQHGAVPRWPPGGTAPTWHRSEGGDLPSGTATR
eukprot:881749-Lingulodinium_polyedra.AAC.1